MTRVLVVDDEPQILRALRVNLSARDYDVETVPTARGALDAAARRPPDLVILDLGLPDMDGVEVIRGLRGWTTVPIIVLSGRTDSTDKVEALDAGADDYLTKPFGVDELLARLRAVLRRAPDGSAGPAAEPRVAVGRWTVDLANHQVTGDGGESVHLTKTEWSVLEILVRHPGRLITQRHLLAEVWGPEYVSETGYLRLYLAQLRRKLEPVPSRPRHLLTEPGMGYRFQP